MISERSKLACHGVKNAKFVGIATNGRILRDFFDLGHDRFDLRRVMRDKAWQYTQQNIASF
jgi:hypothetical protein